MTRLPIFIFLCLTLKLGLTGCGGTSRPELPKPELPDSSWPELSLLIEAVAPLRGGSSEDETLILQVFQSAQFATSVLLQGSVPSSASGPETTRLLEELERHQETMKQFDEFSTENVVAYFRTAEALATIAGLEGP